MECIYDKNLVQIYRHTPNIYYRKADLNQRGQCNGAYLVSGTIVAAVDIPTLEAAEEMKEESSKLFGQPIQYIFLTHGHEDHVDGLPVFLNEPVTIFCSQRLKKRITSSGISHRAAIFGVTGTLTLNLSGLEIELFTMNGTTHSPHDMFIRLPEEQVICTGDAAVEFQTMYFHEADVDNWITVLRKLHELPGKFILPGHGNIYPHTHLISAAEHLETIYRAAEKCLKEIPVEQIRDLNSEEMDAIINGFFKQNTSDAQSIRQKAGNDAVRELRMVFRSMYYKELR